VSTLNSCTPWSPFSCSARCWHLLCGPKQRHFLHSHRRSPTFNNTSTSRTIRLKPFARTMTIYNAFSFQQQQQIQQGQSEIAIETAKVLLDPIALGTLYADIEKTCRALRDKAASSQQKNISLLTDLQRFKLSVLSDVLNFVPTISAAQLDNLLESTVSPPIAFAAGTSSNWTISGSSGMPGCGVNGIVGGVFGGILTHTLSPQAQTGATSQGGLPNSTNRATPPPARFVGTGNAPQFPRPKQSFDTTQSQ
jgi:hypothetical protein